METPFSPRPELVVLPSALPAPGLGSLPVHAFLLRGRAPLLVDAGMALERDAFIDALDSLIDPAALQALVLTHEDADHSGALEQLLQLAPGAKLVTTAVGAGKLSAALALDPERLCLVAPGQTLAIGERRFRVLAAPLYDSPATFMLFEERERLLFSSDAFGAFVGAAAEVFDELDAEETLDGMSLFCRANSPWVVGHDPQVWHRTIEALAALQPAWLFASHLPPTPGFTVGRVFERALRLIHEGSAAPAVVEGLVELAA